MEELINKSLLCSIEYGLKKDHKQSLRIIPEENFKSYLKKNADLINNSIPIITEFIEPCNDTAVVLTDSEGIVLQITGTPSTLEELNYINIYKGVGLSEQYIGTNAVALAIKEKNNFRITKSEHYLAILANWTSTAIPIFNYNNRLIGVIAVFELGHTSHNHTLSLVKLAANAIADKLWNNLIRKQLSNERQYAFNIMNNLSYGLFAVNLDQKIHWVNDTACRALNIRRTDLLNKIIIELIPQWNSIKLLLDKDKILTDEEFTLNFRDTEEKYILNAYSIKSLTNNILGYVITIRPYSRMIKMLGRYSLNSPYFTFKHILGKSEAIKYAIEMAKTASRGPSTILIIGQSGTGKEVFAQSIHNSSNRNNNNFIAINCGAISSSLIESELFGYEEGAFTGALKKGRPGKFELANNGTLFLDEIGEMPLEMQVKLLRAIQEKSITRVGGSKEIPVDVRIIAATNKDLKSEMEKGNFRSDLYYRLSVIPIFLPSLAQRPEDIPLLIQFYLKQKGALLSKPIPEISQDIMDSLVKYAWPGNVRELENTIEKFVLFNGKLENTNLVPKNDSEIELNTATDNTTKTSLEPLQDIEKNAIQNTLDQLNWNISKAAETLGIGRNTLYEKIKRYRINK